MLIVPPPLDVRKAPQAIQIYANQLPPPAPAVVQQPAAQQPAAQQPAGQQGAQQGGGPAVIQNQGQVGQGQQGGKRPAEEDDRDPKRQCPEGAPESEGLDNEWRCPRVLGQGGEGSAYLQVRVDDSNNITNVSEFLAHPSRTK